ncbi:hypothetical protein [Streptomyces alkaliterrae]|uniref:Uncharacterized protein n=1 Tax=Streptomyces alkaliterrae TaxID=2213162 RepID=A0A5P0YK66_9ACTN|nr:hypothetical protein [Streptomyces alkaliterrae]MBB1251853.1 hypothetical protein [Streptomyces alkaliterrae]MBB1259312.1 hypothetical protein [Streptomyces alkaliterrae]MQS00310.1 hypothetical protein [Streptomyces alkaliterrae]
MGVADNSDQRHMRRITLDISYEQLNGLLATLTLSKEADERFAAKAKHSGTRFAAELCARWTQEHIDRLRAAWDLGQPLEERAESQGITLHGVTGVGTVHVFSDDMETHVTFEERDDEEEGER